MKKNCLNKFGSKSENVTEEYGQFKKKGNNVSMPQCSPSSVASGSAYVPTFVIPSSSASG